MKKIIMLVAAVCLIGLAGCTIEPSHYNYSLTDEFSVESVDHFITYIERTIPKYVPAVLNIRINSYGGDARSLITLLNKLDQYPLLTIKTHNIGLVASAGFILWARGDERYMDNNTLFLSHYCSGYGNQDPAVVKIRKYFNSYIERVYNKYLGVGSVSILLKEGEDRVFTDAEILNFGFGGYYNAVH